MPIEDLELFNTPRIMELRERALAAKDENDRQAFLMSLTNEIVNKLSDITISKVDDSVTINNFDEVKASLRNELTRANKPLIQFLKELNLNSQQMTSLMKQIEDKSFDTFKTGFMPVFVKKPKEIVEVSNLLDIRFPDNTSVNNLQELEKYFSELSDVIRETFNIPPPQVNVEAPQVNVPESIVNIPDIDLDPIKERLKAIQQSLVKIKNNRVTNPLAVRLSDGQNFIDAMEKLVQKQQIAFEGFSGVTKISGSRGGPIDPATDATVGRLSRGALTNQANVAISNAGGSGEVQITLTSGKRQMTIQNTGTKFVYIGGTGVSASSFAYVLVPRQIFDFGAVDEGFNFYAICNGTDTSEISVGEYA